MSNHEWADEITCPYCEYETVDSWDYKADYGELECDECEKAFTYTRHIWINYETEKIGNND